MFFRTSLFSFGSPTLTASKSRICCSWLNLMSKVILKASALSSITFASCLILYPSVSSTSNVNFGLNFCSFLAVNVISTYSSLHGLIVPFTLLTTNSSGRPSTPVSFHLIGIEQTFFNVRVFVSFFSRSKRSNSTTSWSTSTTGLAPRHYTGKITGVGLSFRRHITSSLNGRAWSGNEYTVRCFVSSILRSICSGSMMKGDFSPVPPSSTGSDDLRVNVA